MSVNSAHFRLPRLFSIAGLVPRHFPFQVIGDAFIDCRGRSRVRNSDLNPDWLRIGILHRRPTNLSLAQHVGFCRLPITSVLVLSRRSSVSNNVALSERTNSTHTLLRLLSKYRDADASGVPSLPTDLSLLINHSMKQSTIFVLMFLGLPLVAKCTSVTYFTPAGSTFAGLPEIFSVTITTAANTITVAFTNLTSNPTADTQAISGLLFVLDTADANTPTLPSAPQGIGNLINITSTSTAATPDNNPLDFNHWRVQNLGTSGATTSINLDVFSGGIPSNLIIGTAPSNVYSNANNSIIKHNPFILQNANFTIAMIGVTSATQVTGATFNVGTTTPQQIAGVAAVSEPGTSMLLSLGAIALGLALRKGRVSRCSARAPAVSSSAA